MASVYFCLAISLFAFGAAHADWNVTDFGAVADGVTDNTEAFQNALDEARKGGGGVVSVPAGRFVIRGNLSIPHAVTLQGSYRATPAAWISDYTRMPGTILMAYAGRGSREGKPFIDLRSSAAIAGLIIVYPEWKQTDVPPIPYPPCISARHTDNAAIIDVSIQNAYEAVDLTKAGRHFVRNLQGYPIWRGLYVDECYDIGRIENVHFWPFGVNYKSDDPYCEWINLNGTAFEFARTDWQYVTNTFCFGYGVGYKFSETSSGSANGNFLGIGADCCERAVVVEKCQPAGLLITNGEFVGRWGSKGSVCIEIGDKVTGKVSLTNCSFWGPIDRAVWMRSPNGQFTANACNFKNWDVKGVESPTLAIEKGRAIISGNTFGDGDLHVSVGEEVVSAIISGNQAEGGIILENKAGTRMQAFGNELPPLPLTGDERAHYTVQIGAREDARIVKSWHGREPAGAEWGKPGTKRWSMPGSKLVLPVLPGREYEVEMEVLVPEYALQAGAGVYLGSRAIIAFEKPGMFVLKGKLPKTEADTQSLEIKCRVWTPKEVMQDSDDGRLLGVAVKSVTMKAIGAAGAPTRQKTDAK